MRNKKKQTLNRRLSETWKYTIRLAAILQHTCLPYIYHKHTCTFTDSWKKKDSLLMWWISVAAMTSTGMGAFNSTGSKGSNLREATILLHNRGSAAKAGPNSSNRSDRLLQKNIHLYIAQICDFFSKWNLMPNIASGKQTCTILKYAKNYSKLIWKTESSGSDGICCFRVLC